MCVSIPLEQGRFFNQVYASRSARNASRNPFGAGTVFQLIFPNGVPSLPMQKTTGKNPLIRMLKVMITPMTLHNSNHPNRVDNVHNLNRSSNNATRDRRNAHPRRVKTLRSNVKPSPSRDNRASVAGTLLLNPTPPRKTPVFRADFHTAGFCSFPSLSRSSRLQIQQCVETRCSRVSKSLHLCAKRDGTKPPLDGWFYFACEMAAQTPPVIFAKIES